MALSGVAILFLKETRDLGLADSISEVKVMENSKAMDNVIISNGDSNFSVVQSKIPEKNGISNQGFDSLDDMKK